jgi:hypothetical protein
MTHWKYSNDEGAARAVSVVAQQYGDDSNPNNWRITDTTSTNNAVGGGSAPNVNATGSATPTSNSNANPTSNSDTEKNAKKRRRPGISEIEATKRRMREVIKSKQYQSAELCQAVQDGITTKVKSLLVDFADPDSMERGKPCLAIAATKGYVKVRLSNGI